jgi:DNA adenine methylase
MIRAKRQDSSKTVRPFIKWAGGKTNLIPTLSSRLPNHYRTFYEPFCGGAALFFWVKPSQGVLSDINPDLINLYKVVRNNPEDLLEFLGLHKQEHSAEYYKYVRDLYNSPVKHFWSPLVRASWFLYLNKTCFNGLYRVNQQGKFNVPIGDYKDPKIQSRSTITECSAVLRQAQIICGDYSKVLEKAQHQDFCYLDPPYLPLEGSKNFTQYTQGGFGLEEHYELRSYCDELTARGVQWMLSNSGCELVNDLYSQYQIETVQAPRSINSKANDRGDVTEYLIRNY